MATGFIALPEVTAIGSLLIADQPGVSSVAGVGQWGIFKSDGTPILTVDSVASIEYARDYHISDYPQEKGAFESYNKVQVPYQVKVSFLVNGSRFDFLNTIEAVVKTLDFVVVATPEVSYINANLTHYGYRREATSGVSLLRIDVWCEEVRIPTQPAQNGQINLTGLQGTRSPATQSLNAASPTQSGQLQAIDTIQANPIATNTSVGGNFITSNLTATQLTLSPDLQNVSGPLGLPLGSSLGIPDYIPAGVPNSTGGGASTTQTVVGGVVVPVLDLPKF